MLSLSNISKTNERLTTVLRLVYNKFLISSSLLSPTEPNWGLPLAVAANLHIPYRIEMGMENIDIADIEDARGKGKRGCSIEASKFPPSSYVSRV